MRVCAHARAIEVLYLFLPKVAVTREDVLFSFGSPVAIERALAVVTSADVRLAAELSQIRGNEYISERSAILAACGSVTTTA
jgi:hypothetical protein